MHLYELVNKAVGEAFGLSEPVRTRLSDRDGFDRQCNEAMPLAKKLGENPKELAERIAVMLRTNSLFDAAEVSGPGFINLRIADDTIIEYARKSAFAPLLSPSPESFLLDFGGPNIAKALHVGHLRSMVIGESLRRILLARGHTVVSDIHFGDWGLPMGMLIDELITNWTSHFGEKPLDFEDTTDVLGFYLETLYPKVVTACKDDPARMEKAKQAMVGLQSGNEEMLKVWRLIQAASLKEILPQTDRLGAHFDFLLGESDAQSKIGMVESALQDHLWNEDGTLVVDVSRDTDKKPMPPLIFKKGDGGYTYAATDLATLADRSYDNVLYVVDDRQALHFEQVFRAASHFYQGKLVHVGFGTVNGIDGKPFKTREGGVPLLADMLDAAVAKAAERASSPEDAEKIGIGAVKFADLITTRHSGYVFDLDRIVEPEGKTGPYVQYACVRIAMILAQKELSNAEIVISDPIERELLAICAGFPEAIAMAEEKLMPTFVADYAFSLAQKFSQFYAACYVIGSAEEASRLAICNIVGLVLTRCLELLGIAVPERM